ncbi:MULTISPECIES: anti-phage deoxyguanosine triphosphatase [unclassified Mesorhizobium]|uniref:anti-phage deoxyguanosine triphosphatase n=1 Tax=unclassified Mesorhizobium TaxID=325217 RepID=UPI0013DF1622|nr:MULTISPECIES: anti-phage deoxyguanosine triphosphatase [unclassified Mesorhizobium]MCT2580706.1 anti-phage deoxyguanosine triphosphatase [Mesorhizobium sp. P13.3]MDF3169648.1 anti-phage deoxyguanosine triphosphatase [Mesorhizobium sp. P16.1]MDF3179500.1 anti-phage deoxyguanosine triphosphatase [Mesorhizobium sp. P17.1]MDF3186563.1 anti-phage deoxyguanosine triphosphatase [Mesorhizobium sp. ICCV3110.1]
MYSDEDRQRQNGEAGDSDPWRPPFVRDFGRIIHSASFRRLQGKTQVFPGHESDFFRNRLTHSLEVSQIAEGIADRLNHLYDEALGDRKIDSRLCAAAGLVHDIGHPPFGHNGERALDGKMRMYGGFEGNAQTLRILSRLEKKAKYEKPVDGDVRAGMNLCFRTLAAVLKYDVEIETERPEATKPKKGYYASEAKIVADIKQKVLGGTQVPANTNFKTVECAIMDIADDIAYSVYDLEDSLKAGFLTPASILGTDDELLGRVAKDVTKELKDEIGENISMQQVQATFVAIFSDIFAIGETKTSDVEDERQQADIANFINAIRASRDLNMDAGKRMKLSSELVHEFINDVELTINEEFPALSTVKLVKSTRIKVEILKQYTYLSTIYSNRVKLGEYRGTQLVEDIFDALEKENGHLLMPDDVRKQVQDADKDKALKARHICDFVAGMTDRYAVEFWARLRSDAAESIFKPI